MKFCKIGLKNTLFIFGRKNGRLLLLLFVVCCLLLQFFVRFWLTFFLNWSSRQAEKDAFKEKIIPCTVWELLNP